MKQKRDILEILAKNIRGRRHELGWSQEELADKCGLHRTYVGGVERAERNITLQTLNALATALGVSPASLIRARDNHDV